MVLSALRGQRVQGMTSIGRVLYVERLTAGSTAAARKCLLITRKIIIPPPDSRDPPDRPPYFTKKMFPPDCWDPPATSSHARKCVHITGKINDSPPDCWDPPATSSHARKCVHITGKKMIRPPDCWDPLATSSHARKCVTVGTHPVKLYVAFSFWSRTCTYILVDVEARMFRIRGAHMS